MGKTLSKIKYPKLSLLLLTYIIAFVIFSERNFLPFHNLLLSLGYIGSFFTGILYVYGYSAGPATAVLFILSKEQSILLAGLVSGFGALVGDLIIFRFIRHTLSDEIEKLSKKKIVSDIADSVPDSMKRYCLPLLAAFIIASPLPDEIGVSLLAAGRISARAFSIVSYLLNTAGIFAILITGRLI